MLHILNELLTILRILKNYDFSFSVFFFNHESFLMWSLLEKKLYLIRGQDFLSSKADAASES